jgi:hypothetical protein
VVEVEEEVYTAKGIRFNAKWSGKSPTHRRIIASSTAETISCVVEEIMVYVHY